MTNIQKYFQLLLVTLLVCSIGCASQQERVESYYHKALNHFQQGAYKDAQLEVKNALRIDPDYALGRLLLGKTLFHLQDWQMAHRALLQAIELDEGLMEAHLYLGRIYRMAGELEKAEKKAALVLENAPNNSQALLLQAMVLVQRGDTEGGEAILSSLLRTKPSEEVFALAGQLQQKAGNIQQALEILDAGLEIFPDSRLLLQIKAGVYMHNRDVDLAIEIYRSLINAYPDDADLQLSLVRLCLEAENITAARQFLVEMVNRHQMRTDVPLLLAQLYIQDENHLAAQSVLEQAVQRMPDNSSLLLALTHSYAESGREEEAEKLLHHAVGEHPQSLKALEAAKALAEIYASRGSYDLALENLNFVLNRNPHDVAALFLQGRILVDRKAPESAIQALRQVVRINPEHAEAYYLLARAHQMNGAPLLTEENLQRALTIDPDLVSARKALAVYYLQQGNPDRALQEVELGLEKAPDDPESWILKGRILSSLGQEEKARQTYRSALLCAPGWEVPHLILAQSLAGCGKQQAAIDVLHAAGNEYNVKSLPVQLALATMYQKVGQEHKAEALYQDILRHDPNSMTAANNLAFLYADKKPCPENLKKALELATQAAAGKDPTALDTLGWVYYRLGNHEKALQSLLQARQGNPENMDVVYHLAVVLADSGDIKRALDVISESLERHEMAGVDERIAQLYKSLKM